MSFNLYGQKLLNLIDWVLLMQARFYANDRVYKSFLDILNMYRMEAKSIAEVYKEVSAVWCLCLCYQVTLWKICYFCFSLDTHFNHILDFSRLLHFSRTMWIFLGSLLIFFLILQE